MSKNVRVTIKLRAALVLFTTSQCASAGAVPMVSMAMYKLSGAFTMVAWPQVSFDDQASTMSNIPKSVSNFLIPKYTKG